jgi:Putative adhesin
MRLRHAISTSTLLILLSACSWANTVEGSFDRTLNVSSGSVDLNIRTGAGSITVRSGRGNTVSVHAKIQARDNWLWNSGLSAEEKVKKLEANPPIEQTGNSVRIGHISDESLRNNVAISYEIVTPHDTRLHSTTGSGSQQISDIGGTVRVSTGSGNLRLENIGGEVRANSGSGAIEVRNVKAYTYTDTGSGTIQAIGIAGGFFGRTGSGDIRFEQTAPGSVQAQAGSGSIHLKNVNGSLEAGTGSGDLEVQGEIAGDWRLHTGSGSVRVALPSSARFDVNADSGSGSVTIDHPVTVQGTMRRNHIEGAVNGGGVKLHINTGSGSIHVI